MRSGILYVIGAALLLGSCVPMPVRDSAPEKAGPAQAPGSPGTTASARFGFEQVSGPAPVRNGETRITVAAAQDLTLMAFMFRKGDNSGNTITVPVERTGTHTWTLKPAFPEIATFTITLAGKPVDDPAQSYSTLAQWSVDATSVRTAETTAGRAGAGTGDGWFLEYRTLKEYGLTIVEAPRQNTVGSETMIVVSSDQDLELSAAVWRPDSVKSSGGRSISGMTSVERAAGIWRCRIAFPESGDFLVTLSVRRPGAAESSYHGAAEWRLRAEVKPGEQVVLSSTGPGPAPAGTAPAQAARTALAAAVAGKNIPEIRSWLKSCASQDRREKAAAVAALKSVLFETVRDRSAEVRRLLEAAGMDPNLLDENDSPILLSAVDHDRIDVAAWLLERGADVNARGKWGETALHALSGVMDNPVETHGEWVRLFLRHGVDLDAQSAEGDTALCYAAQSDRQHALLVSLIENGADFDLGNNEGNAPLSHASQHNARQNTEYLTSRGARLYSYEFPSANDAAPCQAVLSGDPAAVGSIPREEFGRMVARTSLLVPATALHLAAEQGSLRVLQALCAKKVDWNVPDRYGRSPLQLAVLAGRADVVSLLLDNGADPNFAGVHRSTPFVAACATQPLIARQMLAKGFVPQGEAVAKAAVASEDLDLVKALGNTVKWDYGALSFAAGAGLVEITEYLGAHMNLPPKSLSEYVERARESRKRSREYRAQASRPLEAPRRSGGIAAQRGTFPYVVESWSPWLQHDAAKLADYPVGIYVPKTYDGRQPFGLVVSMTNAKSSSRYPRDFTATLDRHNLIWVGFDPYNGLHAIAEANAAFCLAIVYNMLGYYNIDQSRIYIGGYSLGGQMTERILRTHPWVFDGAFFINIAYSGGLSSKPEWYYCKHHMPIVWVEGDYDYNRTWAYKEYDELLGSGYRGIHFSHEPMKGHKLISAASFERIVSLLDAGRK